ncbi:MAG: ATP-dependent DNA helicase, partial [Oscillospiraceae bacterium]|nr:ATP-dependent DNA helicase [Oscillospiraceae bacterium]
MLSEKISVRALAEQGAQSGDIDARAQASVKPAEGARLHRLRQKSAPEGYTPEVALSAVPVIEDVEFTVSGRADGVIFGEDAVTIDEIKTTLRALDSVTQADNPAHWAQAKCYGHMCALEYGFSEVSVRLTYLHALTGETRQITRAFSAEELDDFFAALLKKRVRWVRLAAARREELLRSCRELLFPFDSFRSGQRRFAGAVYRSVTDARDLIALAPTGTGKTISTLFPALKAMEEGGCERIFYFTAKETARAAAAGAVKILTTRGLFAAAIVLTAKEKLCPNFRCECNPDACGRARGHFDRVDDARYDALGRADFFDRESVSALAEEYNVCPFELALDLSLNCDIIICDYNYGIDPKVYLKRFFSEPEGKFVFLCDEAHNLPD